LANAKTQLKAGKVKVGHKYLPEKGREEKRKAVAEVPAKETKRVDELDSYDFTDIALFPFRCC
jgi:hypothetical protein